MTEVKYNFLDDNFTTFENVETPKVTLNIPLMDSHLDISDWASGISSSGIPIVKDVTKKYTMTVNNTEESPITQYNQNPSLNGKRKEAMDFFQSKGLSLYAAAGIVGNLMYESGLDPTISSDKGTSYGIAQWHNDRWDNLKAYAKAMRTDESDFNTQLNFLYEELSTNKRFRGLIDKLNKSRNSDEAAIIFMNEFEVPSEKAKLQSSKKRRENAASLLN